MTSDFLRLGGTVLETVNKGNPFEFPMPDGTVKDRSAEAIEGFRALDLDALIGIGGDGSARILARLAKAARSRSSACRRPSTTILPRPISPSAT